MTRAREVFGNAPHGAARQRVDILLVTQPGGHLLELIGLRGAWHQFSHAWVTLDTVDARSLLSQERVFIARGPTVRSLGNLIRNLVLAWRIVRELRPAAILTTGSALAVPFAWVGRFLGARVVYVECGGRADSPSLACRLVRPVASLVYVQWPKLLETLPRARYVGRVRFSPLDEPLSAGASPELRQNVTVFATVGTCPFPFDRLIRALDDLPDSENVVVQTGCTRARPARGLSVDYLPFDALNAYIRRARVVITHAGIGSVLLAQANGKRPIVLPRLARLGENVDEHQSAFARAMAAEGTITLLDDPEQLPKVLEEGVGLTLPAGGEADHRLADELLTYFRGISVTGRSSDALRPLPRRLVVVGNASMDRFRQQDRGICRSAISVSRRANDTD